MIGLEEVLRRGAASAVSSLRGAFTSHKRTRTTPTTKEHPKQEIGDAAVDRIPLFVKAQQVLQPGARRMTRQLHTFTFVSQIMPQI